MKVREYRSRDFGVLVRFYREFFNEMREWQGWGHLQLTDEDAAATAKESLDPQSAMFVAEDSGQLVGFARVQLWDGAYFIREVFVATPYRRKKVGSKLLAKCEEHVRKQGEISVFLTVEPQHAISLRFLIRNGYDTLNMLELRKEVGEAGVPQRRGEVRILGHTLRLLRRKTQRKPHDR
jgi:ribosomal protein S18 acetylase RimI-like enzyme